MMKCISITIAAVLIGIMIGWYMHMPKSVMPAIFVRENPTDYKFIDPVLLLQVPEDTTTPEFQSLKKEISNYTDMGIDQKKATAISVYFRQLNDDQWVGINADQTYAPASMSKVISMVAFLREAQKDPSLLTKSTSIDNNADSSQDYYPSTHPALLGQSYPAAELVNDMIIYSDNNSALAINDLIGKNALDKTYTDLKLPPPDQDISVDTMSPKMFSHIFRSLYNGAYLSDAISEQSLELLSKTTFNQGLVAGVPTGIVVSHKFGERTLLPSAEGNTSTIRELHDCGIIYAPHDPYLLCVMTKGTAFSNLQKIISDISSITWSSVQQLNVKK